MIEQLELSRKYAESLGGDNLLSSVPYLRFKPEWEVSIRFPFSGAAARFFVRNGEAKVSAYLDTADVLGCVGRPYWEIYPNAEGDCSRVLMNETDELIKLIDASISAQLEKQS